MDIERLSALLAVLLPVLLVLEVVLALALWRWNGWESPHAFSIAEDHGRRGRLMSEARIAGIWLALTIGVLWVAFLVGFFLIHGLLFTLGRGPALVGILACLAIFVATPFATGLAVRRRVHHE